MVEERLGQLLDRLRESLSRAEGFLVAKFSGVDGEIQLPEGPMLLFCKFDGRTGLYVDTGNLTPVCSASAHIRKLVAQNLSELVDVLRDRSEIRIEDLRKTITDLDTYVDLLVEEGNHGT